VNPWEIVGATGHRPKHLTGTGAQWARQQSLRCLRHCRDRLGTTTVVSGLALGWDTWIAEDALLLGLDLWAHMPFPQQPAKWRPHEQVRWRHLVDSATQVTTYGESYHVHHLHERNAGMIREAGTMLALWNPARTTGGTAGAVRAIADAQRPWVHLDPAGQTIEPPGQCVHPVGEARPDRGEDAQETLPI
jgi:hypothetical protein